jgi:hypothetical protein
MTPLTIAPPPVEPLARGGDLHCQACGLPGEQIMSLPPTPKVPERLALVCNACAKRLMIYGPILGTYLRREGVGTPAAMRRLKRPRAL